MIDLHAHMLPDIDDGPRQMDQSVEMAAVYVAAGFSKVAVTPHWVEGSIWQPTPQKVREGLARLDAALKRRGIGLALGQGAEVAMTLGMAALLRQGRVLTLNGGGYVLVEPPFRRLPLGWEQILFEVSAAGYQALLAHPERCAHLAAQPRILDRMKQMGVGIQINWKSLMGRYGNAVQETAWSFLETGRAHCLATDGHGPDDIDGRRLAPMRQALTRRLGAARARLLVERNPERIWNSEKLEDLTPCRTVDKRKKRRRWFIWG